MRKVIITGASSGLGHEIAASLIKEGAQVINLSRRPSTLPVINIKTDLTNATSIRSALARLKRHKDIDLLINNAGVLHWHAVGTTPLEEIDADFAANVTGAIKITDALMPTILKNKGDVVFVGSTSSFVAHGGSSVYTAAKHGLAGYIKSLQAELKREDVRIIGIHPGGMQSGFHIKAKSNLKQESLMEPKYVAYILLDILKLPRSMEVSEIIINRKTKQ